MMKRIASSLLILIVLIGTVGFSYDAHFCGGELVSDQYAFLAEDLSCGMTMEPINKDHSEVLYAPCCSNQHETFQIEDDYVDYDSQSPSADVDFMFADIQCGINMISVSTDYSLIGYLPPPSEADLILLNQTFLI